MTRALEPPQPAVSREDVARGAWLAGISRMGALIEALAQPLYTWLFGIAGYGVYVVLWGAVSLATNVVHLAMPLALQRVVPAEDERGAHGAVKLAILVALLPAMLIALIVSAYAGSIAGLVSAPANELDRLPLAIALFAWALPLWTFIEVATSAARARRGFGPEIRLRIFWEQMARILFALGIFVLGTGSIGLMLAHLCSLALTALLCVPLLARYYDLGLLVRAPMPASLVRVTLLSGLSLMPSNLARRALIDAPPIVLNLVVAGSDGATAAGLFEIARKIATVPLIVRQAFQYVLGPLTSVQANVDRVQIAPLYRFAGRVSTALVIPLAGMLAFASTDVLRVYRPEARAALPLLYVLVGARSIEAIVGPASAIIEMVGHRILPALNSLIAIGLWVAISLWLVPTLGGFGMAIAVGVATVASTYAATIELQVTDNLSPFDAILIRGLGVALAGVALMAATESLLQGPARFTACFLIWAAASWLALRHGLTREDRLALGAVSKRLRLV